ncbi:MAG: BREX-1 system phosphatase PglZ type B, partial [Rhodospirillaceae bacterium]|nr:BREX-1 system phosphatase PglZ type B [Rhodospirillaceae bacterium]
DAQTREAMLRALILLAEKPIAGLKGKRLEAEDFERLAIGDPVGDVLTWMTDPEAFESRADNDRWKTFCNVCKREFSFNPEEHGVDAAATALLSSDDKWDDAWRRFSEAPQLYPGVRDALRNAQPADLLSLVDRSRQPGFNEEQEDKLLTSLEEALELPHADACDRIGALDQEHRERRGWVWAQIGESPYAQALEPLGRLALAAKQPLGAPSIETLVLDYTGHGWHCDQASLDALSCLAPGPERDLVAKVVRTLYQPWLDSSARNFQDVLSAGGVEENTFVTGVNSEPEVCVLFVDGLRFDLGAKLHSLLEEQGYSVTLTHRLAPIPTVTATAKPMASPAHAACGSNDDATDFYPSIDGTAHPANAGRLRDSMARAGVEILEKDEYRMGLGVEHGAWSEIGRIDELGHKLNVHLVQHINTELNAIISRVGVLLNAGWRKVRLVTDHGWLLLPGGLPKVDVPASVVESKWARCAVVKGESISTVPTYPWHWNQMIQVASPPGIGAFRANNEYAHGGVSLQECVVPELIVERGVTAVSASIHSVSWRGMRCRIGVETGSLGISVDLRQNWRQPETSLAAAKQLDAKGEASLAVADDRHEGAAATVVVLDSTGRVLDRRPTTVGEDR